MHPHPTRFSILKTSMAVVHMLTLSFWTPMYTAFANSADPDQLASEEANWSGSALFIIKHVNLYQQSGSINLIGWNLEVGVAC